MSGIDINSVSDTMVPQIGQEENKLTEMLKDIDVSDPASMIKMQMEYSKYNMEIGFVSSLVKNIKDAVSQILQKL